MLRNSRKPKSIIFTIALTTILNSYSSLAYAKTYDSSNIVKNYDELQSEVVKGLEMGATDVKIKFDGQYLTEFCATGNKGLGDLINSAKYKVNNDYFANEMYKYAYEGQGNDITFTFEYLETEDETKQVDEKVKEIIKDKIKPNMSEDEKVKVIHDYIVTHVQYDLNGLKKGKEAHTAYAGLFRDKQDEPNETVCQGYALLFYKMAKEAGLDARIMTGKSFSKSANQPPQAHAWNLIKINGNWYQIDLTWDDPVMSKPDPNYVRYDYYNLSDEEMQKDHIYNDPDKFPKCINKYKDKANDEFILKEIGRMDEDVIVASDEQELRSKLLEKIKQGQATVKVKYKDAGTIQNVLRDLSYNRTINGYGGFSYSQYSDGYLCTIPLHLKLTVSEIKPEKESYELELNKPDSFKIMASFSDGKQKNVTNEVRVISSDKSKVVIDKNKGTILGTHKGFIKLQVIYGDKTKEINVNIVDAKKSNNANISSITVDGEALEGFSEDKLEYSVEAKSLDNISKIDATLSDVKGKLEIVQATNLKGQENEKIALINVEAEDGTKRQYKVIFDTINQEKLEQQKLEEQKKQAQEEEQKLKEQQIQEAEKKKLEQQRAEEERQKKEQAEKQRLEEQQKLEAQQRQEAEEERQRVERENKAKEEQQRIEQAEKEKQRIAKEKEAQEEKQKLEQQRAEEERQRVERENKAKEEQQKKEQAEKQRLEEKQKLEDKQRAEEERQRVERENKAKEEQQKREQAEKQRLEEKQKLEEQQKAEQERQRVEKENKAQEEQQRREQAEKQAQEEKKKQDALAKQKLEDEKKQAQEAQQKKEAENQKLDQQNPEEKEQKIEKENKAHEEQQRREQAEKQVQEDKNKEDALAKQKLEDEKKQAQEAQQKKEAENQKLNQQNPEEKEQKIEKENKAHEEQQRREQAEKQAQEDQKKQEAITKQKLEKQRAEKEKQRIAKEKEAQEQKQKLEQQRAEEERQRVERENKAKEEQQKKEQAEKQRLEEQQKKEKNKNVIRIQRNNNSGSGSSGGSSNRVSTTSSGAVTSKQHKNYHRKQVTPEQKRDIINNILSMDNTCKKTEFKEEINKAIRYSNVEIWGKDRKEDKTSLDHNFVIEFNRNVNSTDLNSKIILFDKNTGERVDVNFEIGGNGRLVKINKKENFKEGRSYILFINKNLEDSFNKQRLNKVILMEINC